MFLSKYWAAICRIMPDKMYLKWQFKHIYHKKLDIDHPKTYADKLAYLKTHDRDDRLTELVDKFEVRKYVSKTIGDKYLIPLIGVYDDVCDIPWSQLPDKYVLKCTHDSASVVLHFSEDTFDRSTAIKSLNKHMSRNMYWYSREYPYKDVKPRIVCESFLSENGKAPADYKIMCFNGKPYYIVLDMDRFGDHHRDFYDVNWVKQDVTTDHEQGICAAPRPDTLEEMLILAKKLSTGFKHVRVDFYSVSGRVYFGEMTFFPWGGPIWFKPDEWNYKLGDLIQI